jgi:hypothetical protein
MRWENLRIKLREQIMPDARRMSYKKLGDRYRRELLLPILKAADELNGLSISVAINKTCDSLFSSSGPPDLKNPDFSTFLKWQPNVLEKAFIILHCLGILVAGTASKRQNLFWFTDQDAIAASVCIGSDFVCCRQDLIRSDADCIGHRRVRLSQTAATDFAPDGARGWLQLLLPLGVAL